MGAIHIDSYDLEEAAFFGAASAGTILAVRLEKSELDLRLDWALEPPWGETLAGRLRVRRPWRERLRAWLHRPEHKVRTFEISPPPVMLDAYSHPVFTRLVGGLRLDEVAPGQRVIVIESASVEPVADEPAIRARLLAAARRRRDAGWVSTASVEELRGALSRRRRWDLALLELERRGGLEIELLVATLARRPLAAVAFLVRRIGIGRRDQLITSAAAHVQKTGDRAALVKLVRTLHDIVPLQDLEPLLLLLDRGRAKEETELEIAQLRLQRLLEDQPQLSNQLRRLRQHLRV